MVASDSVILRPVVCSWRNAVYDALTSDRPYRAAWTHEHAIAHIDAGACAHFEPDVGNPSSRCRLTAARTTSEADDAKRGSLARSASGSGLRSVWFPL